MFKKLRKLFFVEETQNEVVVETEEEKVVEVNENNFEQTIAITSLDKVEEEQVTPMTTFTIDNSRNHQYSRNKNPQPAYEFETIISPISGRTPKKGEPKFNRSNEKKETVVYSHVISPMFGQRKTETKIEQKLAEEGQEMSLEDFLNTDENKEVELVQFSLFEGEKE